MYFARLTGHKIILWLLWLGLCLASCFSIAEIYQYKTADGKIIYTNKKPTQENLPAQVKVIEEKTTTEKKIEPQFSQTYVNGLTALKVKNPFFAPIEIKMETSDLDGKIKLFSVSAQHERILYKVNGKLSDYSYHWQLGDSVQKPGEQIYDIPVPQESCLQVMQGFNGKFSHTDEQNRYAVDIGGQVGTKILAAKSGVVVQVKDDYPMGGTSEYFLDKANYVRVLHDDGTFGIYLHLLLGSAKVKVGEQVEAGRVLAQIGSTGFSTGPHLHFAVMRNSGMKEISIPFQFKNNHGKIFTPQQGQSLCVEN